jgi:hypothetical protein
MVVHLADFGENVYALPSKDAAVDQYLAVARRDHRRGMAALWAIEAPSEVTLYRSSKEAAKACLREMAAAVRARRARS